MKMITIPNEACCEQYSFFSENAEFVCSVDKCRLVVNIRFLDEEGAENIKYKLGDLEDILPK